MLLTMVPQCVPLYLHEVVYMKRMFEMHAVLPCDIMPDMWIKDIS